MKRKDFEEIKKDFYSIGYIVLDNHYINNKTNMSIIDEEGYKYYASYNSLKNILLSGGDFKKFHPNNPYTIENINLFLIKSNSNTKLVSTKYESATKNMKWQCGKCGKIFEKSFIKIEVCTYYCQECGMKMLSDSRKLSIKKKQDILNKYKFKTTVNLKDVKITDSIHMISEEGYMFNTSLLNISITNGGYEFIGKNNKHSLYNINLFLKNNGLKSMAINFKSARENIEFKCECGETFERVWSAVKSSSTFNLCPKCSQKLFGSSYSKTVEEWLIQNNIDYEVEKTFEDCRNKLKLPFDFYIPSLDILIEVDGEQHFRPVNFGGMTDEKAKLIFTQTINRDDMKNKWCKKHNKTLIRISYLDIKDKSYVDKLKTILKLG